MKTRKITFRLIYLIYVLILAALVTAAVLYVRSLLQEYEASQPELQVNAAVEQLVSDATTEGFWEKYNLPNVTAGPFERNRDIKTEYLALYEQSALTFSQSGGSEDTLLYTVTRDGFPLAEVSLKAAGPAVTKLAVLSLREWNVESVTPILKATDYNLTVPNSFGVRVNSTALTAKDGTPSGERQTQYTLSGLYLKPDLVITDQSDNQAEYVLKKDRILVEFFDYSLTLPTALTVTVNGAVAAGEPAGNNLLRYDITTLTKPAITISDDYGNAMDYTGEKELPLTYTTISSDSRYSVLVNDTPVPAHRVSTKENPEFAQFSEFLTDLPTLCEYSIAVLQENASVVAVDQSGNRIVLNDGQPSYDLTNLVHRLDSVPDEVAAQVDVLQIAQNWSMFLTDDLPFDDLKGDLIASSYQYKVALKYATGEDIKFTSRHTLADPAFTENSVTNFTWITEDCFSVDISFVKHMRLYYGAMVDDPMNDRFYFVRYDDTENGVDDPAWKLAAMKEIV